MQAWHARLRRPRGAPGHRDRRRRRRQVAPGARGDRPHRRRRARVCAGAACPTATASRSGRWSRWSAQRPASTRDDTPETAAQQAAALRRRRRRGRPAGLGGRPVHRGVPAARALLGGAPLHARTGQGRAGGGDDRRHPLGRAGVPRPARAPARHRRRTRRSCCWPPRATTCSKNDRKWGERDQRRARLVLKPLSDAAAAQVVGNLLGCGRRCRDTWSSASSRPPKATRCTSSRCCRC